MPLNNPKETTTIYAKEEVEYFVSSHEDESKRGYFMFAYIDAEGNFYLQDTKNPKFLVNREHLNDPPADHPEAKITCISFSKNNQNIAIGYDQGFVRILTINNFG